MNLTSCTIYVGDLPSTTLESDLFSLFNKHGTIRNIKIVRNDKPSTASSECYAYITFENTEDAKKSQEKLNFTTLHNKQIRVMLFDKNPKIHNIIVKNLPTCIDNKTLYDTFKIFGEVLSCKVATDLTGKSKGFGFVSYTDKPAVKKAIKFGNETSLKGNTLKVDKLIKKAERISKKDSVEQSFTNVYIKNFDCEEEELKAILESYGEITSFFAPKKSDNSCVGFAFCNFNRHEDALKAINALHGKEINQIRSMHGLKSRECEADEIVPEPFYIQRAQSKSEREEEIIKYFSKMSVEGQNYKRNLFITNIPENYTSEELLKIFAKLGGKITSFNLKNDNVVHKKIALVCYSTPDEASIAIEKGNDLYLDGTKLNFAYFKSKKERMQEIETNEGDPSFFRCKPTAYKRVDKKQIGGDLFNLVLSMAGIFQDDWKRMGIQDEYSFADKITKALLERPSNEIKNMMGLGNVLSQNISDILNEIKKKRDD